MDYNRKMNLLFDQMLEDLKYSKIAAFSKILYGRESIKKRTTV